MTRARGASRPRFRLLPTLLLTLAILALPTAVYAWGRSSSSFDVKTVRVSGTHLVPARKALKLLRKTYIGENLFTVTAADVRETLKPLSFVASASVDHAFPDTLAVGITEYRPAAYALAGGRWYVLDESGYVICTAQSAAEQLGGKGARAAKPAKPDKTSPSPSSSPSAAAAGATATPSGDATTTPVADASATPVADATATPPVGATATPQGTDGSTASSAQAAGADGAVVAADVATAGADVAAAGESGGLTALLVAGPPGATLPLPSIAVPGRVREGATLGDKTTAEMLRVITALPGSYRRRLAALQDDGGQLVLRFAGGPVATWGDGERTLAKTVALRTVLAQYEKAGKACTQIDVSIPDRTLAKPVLK